MRRMRAESPFSLAVYATVRTIPKGRVASYALIALLCGRPGAARAVGNALHVNPYPGEIPCHRVVKSNGALPSDFAFGGREIQAQLLINEGVEVTDFSVNMKQYGLGQEPGRC